MVPISDKEVAYYATFITGRPDVAPDAQHLAAARAVLEGLAKDERLIPAVTPGAQARGSGAPSVATEIIRCINDQVKSLPNCPVCGYITDLDEIVIKRTAKAGGGQWTAFVLRCVNSVGSEDLRRLKADEGPLCSFVVPMTLQP